MTVRRESERGFRDMKLPILGTFVLKTYTDNLLNTRLLAALANLHLSPPWLSYLCTLRKPISGTQGHRQQE
jgi:hypothetical protein